jgi:hypothetical protein
MATADLELVPNALEAVTEMLYELPALSWPIVYCLVLKKLP